MNSVALQRVIESSGKWSGIVFGGISVGTVMSYTGYYIFHAGCNLVMKSEMKSDLEKSEERLKEEIKRTQEKLEKQITGTKEDLMNKIDSSKNDIILLLNHGKQ